MKYILMTIFCFVSLPKMSPQTYVESKIPTPLETLIRGARYPQDFSLSWWHKNAHGLDPHIFSTALSKYIPIRSFHNFLSEYIISQDLFFNEIAWVNHKTVLSNSGAFTPYVMKIKIADNARVFMWGDLHGDIQAISASLYKLFQNNIIDDSLKLKNPHDYLLFLGDTVDRGWFGLEVITLLIQVALKNPGRVFIIRGNHEEITQNEGSFLEELKAKCADYITLDFSFFLLTYTLNSYYNHLPVAIYLQRDADVIQCCHGGIEIGYDPSQLLTLEKPYAAQTINSLPQEDMVTHILSLSDKKHALNLDILENAQNQFKNIPSSDIRPYNVGFMWNDFAGYLENAPYTSYRQGRGFVFGSTLTHAYLHNCSKDGFMLRGIIRAHQHNDSMKGLLNRKNNGLYSIFNNTVFTTVGTSLFRTGPCFLELSMDSVFDNWQLTQWVHQLQENTWVKKTAPFAQWENTLTL